MDMFKMNKTNMSSPKILCLGDSITNGWHSYPNIMQRLTTISITDGGRGGDTTSKILIRWNNKYKSQGYNIVVVLGGTNDLFQMIDEETIKSNLQKIWQSALNEGCTVYDVTILPACRGLQVMSINAWIRTTAPTIGVHVIDAYGLFEDPNIPTYLNPLYDYGDNTHLNQMGANLLANTIYIAMNGLYNIKNTGNVPETLTMTTSNWTPSGSAHN